LLEMSVLIEHFTPPRQPLMAGRREAGVMADAPPDCNRQGLPLVAGKTPEHAA
jgi:hypothetical protein